jgi:AcrR family transcriptional regulator
MKDRRERILDVAINLAEAGGFENVRQRDVAEQAGVALGTLYKSFRSKEDLLAAALERETRVLERRTSTRPTKGKTELERLCAFFRLVTRELCKKPNFARAVLRAVASGEPEVAANVAAYHGRMLGLAVAAMRGVAAIPGDTEPVTAREGTVASLLMQIWFAALVGWSAGLASEPDIVEQVREGARLLLKATEPEPGA